MESYRHAHQAHTRTSHLTKLYSDTKKSALTSIDVYSTANEHFPAFHRKFKIQKDRLITWGLAWSDDEKGSDCNIDDAVSKAGLAETVESVLRNIKDVTGEAERIQQAALPPHALTHTGDTVTTSLKPAAFDQARYEDLLNDLTASIDTLYDLSLSRRALARGDLPSFGSTSTQKPSGAEKPTPIQRKPLLRKPSFASSETTLVSPPSFHRPSLSPYAGLPPRLEISALRLPEEGPPPYEAVGVPSTTRLVARLIRARASESVQNALGSSAAEVPVLIEYANYDTIYRDTHVPPPLQRLEALATFLQPMRAESQTNLSLLGYFEDPSQPRIGLVYDIPYSIQNRLHGTADAAAQSVAPVSLLKLVQKASKTQLSNGDSAIPALENRFSLALRLTEQLQQMHVRDLPHGNINSGSLILTVAGGENPLRPAQFQLPLWASFDLFSKCSVEGARRDINLNIYRHPDDSPQSSDRTVKADLEYDLYGLALVLLEVGLWTPLADLHKTKYSLADFKLRIEKLWIPKLAHKCGTAYMRVVQTCFRIADDPALSILTTGAIYERLLTRLRRCCQLDEDDFSVSPLLYSDSITDIARPSYDGKTSKKWWDPIPEQSPLSRQQSAFEEPLWSQSIESHTRNAPYRLSSLPNLAAASVPMAYAGMSPSWPVQVSRQPSTRNQIAHRQSISQMKDRMSQRITTTPSFKEYKRKITFIQQRWRERRAQCHAARAGSHGSTVADQVGRGNSTEAEQATRPKRHLFPNLELPQSAKIDWEQKYACQLAKLCERALKNAAESSHIALTM